MFQTTFSTSMVILLGFFLSHCSSKKNSNPFLEKTLAAKDATLTAEQKKKIEDNRIAAEKIKEEKKKAADALAAKTASNGAVMLDESCLDKAQFEKYLLGINKYLKAKAGLKETDLDPNDLKIGAYVEKILSDDANKKPVVEFFQEIDKQILAASDSKCPTTGVKDEKGLADIDGAEPQYNNDKKEKYLGVQFKDKNSNKYSLAAMEGTTPAPVFGIIPYAKK